MTVHRSALVGALVALLSGSGICAFFAAARGNAIAESPPLASRTATDSASLASSQDESAAINSALVTPTAVPGVTPLPDSEESDCEELPPDHPLRSKLNGKRLALDYEGLRKGLERRLLTEAKVRFLSDGRLLAGLGNTLYMLDSRKRVMWKYTPSWILWDFAFVESTGLVYGGAGDGIMFILDGATGHALYCRGQNGKADHTQVVPFGNDICLITNSLAGYREDLDEWALGKIEMIEPDFITAWRGTEALWSLKFPPDAELVVKDDKIFAVTKTDKSIYVRQIIPPKTDARE